LDYRVSGQLSEQAMVLGQNVQPVIHFFGVGFVAPMVEKRGRVAQRKKVAGRVNFEGERKLFHCGRCERSFDNLRQTFRPEHGR